MDTFPKDSRVWVYQSNRAFTLSETQEINALLADFAKRWVSHNQRLTAYGTIVHNRFIVLIVDEGQVGAGGCSIDRSVAFLKDLQAQYQVDLFDRMRFAYLDGEEIISLSREAFANAYQSGAIHDDTFVFDPLVSNKHDFDTAFLKPLGQSWHKRMV